MGDTDKTRSGERSGMIGQSAGAQASDDTKPKVKADNQGQRGETHDPRRNAEIRDKPEGSGSKRRAPGSNQGIDLGLAKAVEEEVADNKIVAARKRNSQSIRMMNTQASLGARSGLFRPLTKQSKHGHARVDCIGPEDRVPCEKLGEKTAVSIAQHQLTTA